MKQSLSICLISAFMLLPNAQAAVTIHLPASTEPLLLNTLAVDALPLKAENGTQQVVFKYRGSYRQQGQQQRFISEAIIVTFNGQDSDYTIEIPPINSSKDADRFNQNPNIAISDNRGTSVEHRVDTLTKNGIQLGRNYQKEIEEYNLTAAPAALVLVEPTQASSTKVQAIVGDKKADKLDQIDAGKMLDFWYQQADQETRESFKKRINQQK